MTDGCRASSLSASKCFVIDSQSCPEQRHRIEATRVERPGKVHVPGLCSVMRGSHTTFDAVDFSTKKGEEDLL